MCHTEDFSTVSDAAVGGGDLVAGVTPRLAPEHECKGGIVFTEQLRVESEGEVDTDADSVRLAMHQPGESSRPDASASPERAQDGRCRRNASALKLRPPRSEAGGHRAPTDCRSRSRPALSRLRTARRKAASSAAYRSYEAAESGRDVRRRSVRRASAPRALRASFWQGRVQNKVQLFTLRGQPVPS